MGANIWPANAVSTNPTYQGRALRQTTVAPFVGGATAARPFGALSGVRPGTSTTIVTATSTIWTVTPFGGVIDGEALNIAGPYAYSFDTNQTGSVTAAAGSARVDRLDVQVSDPAEADGSSTPGIAIVYSAGVAGTGVPVSAPARSHPLALINVPASGGGSPTVTWTAPYAAAAGGVQPVTTSAPAPTASYSGQYVDDGSGLLRSDGTNFRRSGPFSMSAGTVAAGGNTTGATTVTFPTGRFSQPPIVVATLINFVANVNIEVSSVTATSCVIQTFNVSTGSAITGVAFYWQGIQMLSTGGAG